VQAQMRFGSEENAATGEADAAVREAEYGNPSRARRHAMAALEMASGRSVQAIVALALARSGDIGRAQRIAAELVRQFPSDTLLKGYWLPSIRAAIAFEQGRFAPALEELEPTRRFELGAVSPLATTTLYPVYLRGLTLLALRKPAEAKAEFQKILDRPGVAGFSLLVPLAYYGLARSYALEGDPETARSVYSTLFRVWHQADDDVPVIRRAKLDCERLP
jgi:tetratricopeptide (TPR) repeat protein